MIFTLTACASAAQMEGLGEQQEQVWERPWSLEEIRGSSERWSLAADAGLLHFLQEFSQQTISKTHEIEKQLDGLIRDTKTTDCRLHNVFNDFLMLSNTQFIENRVYDEEVAEPIPKPNAGDKPEQEKTREQKEAELIPKVQKAVNFGLQVLESAFEQLDIKAGNSDSEEEEVNERVEPILEPKDLYIDRPLPYIIGSQLFMEQEDVGLGDYSSEEGSIDSDRASGIDSEEEKDGRESDDESENRSEEQRLQTALSDEDDDDDDGSNLFDSEKEDDEENLGDYAKSEKRARPTSFADELAARIKVDVPNKPNEEQTSLPSVESMPHKEVKETRNVPSDDDDDLFKPPKLTDEDFSPFGTQGGLFSGGTGLFDDDEDYLFDAPRGKKENGIKAPLNDEPSPSIPVKKVPVGGVSLFPGGDHVFNPTSVLVEKDKRKSLTPKSETAPKLPTSSGLFDDDEDDFFAKPNPKQPHSGKSAAELFVQEGDSEVLKQRSAIPPLTQNSAVTEPEGTKETTVKKTPSPEVSKTFTQPPQTKHTKGLFSDEEDSEDLFSPSQNVSKSKVSALPASKMTKALSLFDDEEEDNLFGATHAKKQPTIKPPQEKIKSEEPTKTAPSTLFSSDEEDHWDRTKLIKPTSEQKPKEAIAKPGFPKDQSGKVVKQTSLFDDEDDLFAITKDSQKRKQRASLLFEEEVSNEGLLFSAIPVPTQSTLQIPEQDKMDQAPSSLLNEKKEDALVKKTEKKPTEVKIEVEKSNKADETDVFVEQKKEKVDPLMAIMQEDDEELFPGSPPLNKEKKSATKKVLSLFEEEEDDENVEDQLINRNAQKEIKKPFENGAHPKSTGVFQDEELLFSHKLQKDNDPDVDIFASAKKNVSEKPVLAKLSSGAGLFGDEVEDDLFSTAKSKKPLKTPEKKTAAKKDLSHAAKEGSKRPKETQDAKKEETSPGSGSTEDDCVQKPTGQVPFKTKEPASRIGKLQANLSINPSTMLPGAVFRIPGAKPNLPSLGVSSGCLDGAQSIIVSSEKSSNEGVGVSFDSPARMSTLHSANKDRIKVTGKRRPPSRAGRRLASQDSGEMEGTNSLAVPHVSLAEVSAPISVTKPSQTGETKVESVYAVKPSSTASYLTEKQETPAIHDFLGSDDLFTKSAVSKTTMGAKTKSKSTEGFASKPVKEEKKSHLLVLDDPGSDDDLFRSAKQKSTKKTNPSSFLDDESEEDLFGGQNTLKKKDVKYISEQDLKQKTQNIFEDDIFANEAIKPTKKLKEKDKGAESSIFDSTDIFADLTVKPKEKKSKKKVEPKSIFDDEMDDIFSSGNKAKTSKSKVRIDKSSLEAKSESKGSSTFDDPLNAFGGQ